MIKIIFIFLLITTVNAGDIKKASSIFNMVIKNIAHKNTPKVYLHVEIESIKKYPKDLKITTNCSDADVVVLSTLKNIPSTCKDKILFGTRYSHLKNNNVVGAFFWQKGRPNILFYKKRLDKYNIRLGSGFDKYIEN